MDAGQREDSSWQKRGGEGSVIDRANLSNSVFLLQSVVKMATVSEEAVRKLETKAIAAEKLINLLKQQIAEVRAAQVV